VLRVDYAKLVEQTEAVCRETAAFLGVPFDPRMLELNKADLSAIYLSPHHAHLRRGIIERQKYTEELTPPRVARKLERYRHRWERQQAEGLKLPATPQQPEPRPIEFVYHNVVGRALTFYDSAVRAGFGFIPLPWLRAYRLFKNWVVNPPSGTADEKTSMVKEWQQHWPTILAATALLGITAFMEKHADPHLQFLLFYGILCALLALVVNLRWATVFVLASAFLPSVIQYDDGSGYDTAVVFVWNCISRFILLETLVGTLGRIRRGFSKTGDRVG
jgi:hypothetical protein